MKKPSSQRRALLVPVHRLEEIRGGYLEIDSIDLLATDSVETDYAARQASHRVHSPISITVSP